MTETDLDAIGLLQEPARRALYAYVAAQGRAVSRNEAARAVGLQRTLAAFHLDRLADGGLLEVAYRRLTARSGPGAGRPAKLYSRPVGERTVSLPPRDYARAARVFAETIERSGLEPMLFDTARDQGAAAGQALVAEATDSDRLEVGDVTWALAERGYEPYADASGIRLRNCPFNTVANEFPVVACGMNLAWLEGLLAGSGLAAMGHIARMDPRPGECCVVIASKNSDD